MAGTSPAMTKWRLPPVLPLLEQLQRYVNLVSTPPKPPNVKQLSPDAVMAVWPHRHPHRQSSEGWRSRNSL